MPFAPRKYANSIHHTSFVYTEPSKETMLWRYIDLPRFASMLINRKLWLPRSDMFEDKWECTLPPKRAKALAEILNNYHSGWGTQSTDGDLAKKYFEWFRYSHFVSCWHASEDESAAMWKLYSTGTESLAIQTRARLFKAAIDSEKRFIQLGRVEYRDFDGSFGERPTVLVKRKSFLHEQEVRAWYYDHEVMKTAYNEQFNTTPIPPTGIVVDLDLQKLVEAIRISPTANRWFESTVKGLWKQLGMADVPITKSPLYDSPLH